MVFNHKNKQTLIKTKNEYKSRAFTKHLNLSSFDEHFDCQICSNFKIKEPPKNDSQKEYKWCSTDQDLKALTQQNEYAYKPTFQASRTRSKQIKKTVTKECYPKTNKPVSSSFNIPGRICPNCRQEIKKGKPHSCNKKDYFNIVKKLPEKIQEKICSKTISRKQKQHGNKISLTTGGCIRKINLKPKVLKYIEEEQLQKSILQKRSCRSNSQFEFLQKSKRETFGKSMVIPNYKVNEALSNLTDGWLNETCIWLPYQTTGVDVFNKSEARFLIKNKCETCDSFDTVVDLNHNQKDGTKCSQLIPEKSMRIKNGNVERLFNVAFIGGENGDIDKFVEHVAKERKWKMKDITLKIGMDFGQGSLKIMLQIFSKKYIDKCIKYQKPLNTTDTLFIIGIGRCKESYNSSSALYQLANVDKLFKLAIDKKINNCYLATDLSQLNNLFGLKQGNCKFPCINCKYIGRLDKKESLKISVFDKFSPRLKNDWLKCREFLKNVIHKEKSKCKRTVNNLSVENEPVGEYLLQHHLETQCVVPPPLHIMLGLVNTIYTTINKIDPAIIAKLLDEAKINLRGAERGRLNGPQSYKFMSNCEILKKDKSNPEFIKYHKLLKLIKEVNSLYNKVGYCNEKQIKKQEIVMEKIKTQWQNIESLTARPHKLHWLLNHVLDFQKESGFLLGTFSETEFESLHSKFKTILANYTGKISDLKRAIEYWNKLRFYVDETEPKSSKEKSKTVSFNEKISIELLDKKEPAYEEMTDDLFYYGHDYLPVPEPECHIAPEIEKHEDIFHVDSNFYGDEEDYRYLMTGESQEDQSIFKWNKFIYLFFFHSCSVPHFQKKK